MSAIAPLFVQTQMAEAAYADFTDAAGNLIATDAQLQTALEASDFSKAQALAFAGQWQVVGHKPNTVSGFSATIFKDKITDAYTLAIRGSTDFTDFSADAALIGVDGVAVRQLVDLYNFWSRSATTKDQTYAIAQLVLYDSFGNLPSGAIPVGSSPYGIILGDSSQLPDAAMRLATGVIPVGLGSINVTGHSLGGHLAMAFTRLFPNITSNALAVNGLGFKIGNSTVDSLFSILGGAPNFNASRILNVYGIAGPEFAAMNNSVLQQPGGFDGIFIEDGSLILPPVAGHSSVQMTDSAAVYDLFIKLSAQIRNSPPATAMATLKPLFEEGSAQAESSLERIVDALVNFFHLDFPPLAGALNGNRDELYKRIVPLQAITKNLSDANPGMHVDVLASTTTAESLALLASGSAALAYRYALKELNPFAIVGNNVLYDLHNQNGELDLYNPVTKKGTLTSTWLTNRAAFLAWKNTAYTADATSIIRTEFGVNNRSQYADLATRLSITLSEVELPAGSASARQLVFGSDISEVLEGRSKADALYGGGGADYLRGRLDNDILEGGTGMDVYEYVGRKSFGGALNNDGEDVILDTDGKGVLRYVFEEGGVAGTGLGAKSTSTIIRDASIRGSGTGWISADGKFSYQRSQNDLIVTINDDSGGRITLKDFREGDYGIYLFDELRTAPPISSDPILGDRQYQDFNPATPELDIQFDTLGNIKVTDEVVDAVPDTLYGNRPAGAVSPDAPGQNIIAGGGNDSIFSDRPNGDPDNGFGDADRIDAGAGRDRVEAGAGNDWVIGGADGEAFLAGYGMVVGGDVIDGGVGDDALFGDSEATLAAAIQTATTGVPVDAIGDFISGGIGKDWVIGGAGRNTLLGGEGDDIVIGGAGNDNLLSDDNRTAQNLFWSVERQKQPNPSGGNTYRLQFSGTVGLAGTVGGSDALYGGKGEDWIFAGGGDDFVDGGTESDVIFGDGGADVIIGGKGNDVLNGDSGGGVDVALQGGDVLDGGEGNDELQGDGGDDVLIGDAGNDVLRGGDGNDILIGGTGNDVLIGGAGKDIYVYNRGDGVDVIVDVDTQANSPDKSVLVLGDGIKRQDIKFRLGSLLVDLGLSDPDDPNSGRDQIHFEGFNSSDPLAARVIGEIRFADGEVMTYDDILAQGFDLDGTAGDDVIDGTSVTDRINSFAGNDDIAAHDGDDVIDAGDGDDIVDAGAGDDVVTGGLGNDEILAFAGNDAIDGGDGADLINGGDGNDVLDGGADADRLAGGQDADQLAGGNGDDRLDGGAGNDVLAGGAGSDTYLLYGGINTDTVSDGHGGETNIVEIVGGLTVDAVTARRDGDAVRVSLKGLDDALVIADYYSRPQDWVLRDATGVETALDPLIDQPDSSAGDVVSRLWAETRSGQLARSVGRAYSIGWQPVGGYVFNSLAEDAYLQATTQTTTETFTRVLPPQEVIAQNVTHESSEQLLSYGRWFQSAMETGQQISDDALIHGASSLSQLENVVDAELTLRRDRNLLNLQNFSSSQSGNIVSYDTGTEVVLASVRYDYEGQSYNRLARASYASYTGPEHIPLGVINGNQARVSVQQFIDRRLVVNEIVAGASNNTIVVSGGDAFFGLVTLVDAGSGNDTISGSGFARGGLFFGNAGNDIISGTGSTLIGGDGADQLSGEGGTRFVYTATESGIDRISENTIYTETYLDWHYRGLGIDNWAVRAEHGGQYEAAFETDGIGYNYFDTYEEAFAARPEAVITYLEPLPAAPIIQRNDKTSIAALAAAGVLPLDVITFGPGITPDDLTLTVAANDELPGHADQPLSGGGTLSVGWGDAGFDVAVPDLEFGFTGVLGSYRLGEGVEIFEFSDGVRYTLDELLAQAAVRYEFGDGRLYQTGTPGNDVLFGGFNNDTLNGRDGDDFVWGDAGDDTLMGGAGDDSLVGREGNDSLDGGAGNDAYDGGAGADRYHFGAGSGRDELSADNEDIIVAADSLTSEDVVISRLGINLLVGVRGSTDQIEIYDWYDDPAARVAGLAFADGTFIDADSMEAMLETVPATPGDDRIGGSNDSDVLDGLAGNDEIYGNDGDDVIAGSDGDDWMDGGSGIDILRGGAGFDQVRGEDGAGVLDGGADDDDLYDGFGRQFIAGGSGNDYVGVYGDYSVIAFNPGDGTDTVYAAAALTLSIGGSIGVADLTLSLDVESDDLILSIGASDSIRLTRQYEADPQAWPPITLQLFGSAHLYDFNGAIAALYNHTDSVLALGEVLPALEFESSASSGLGGQLAQQYQLHGNLEGLADAEMRAIVSAADFGVALQPLTSGLTLIGTEFADTLTGGPGNDWIDGLAGADRMLGGEGDDHYTVDQTGDVVVELSQQGHDAVSSGVTYTLAAEVEDLVLTGTANLNGTGNALANTITGNAGANRLDGKAGADVLAGGAGNDTYLIDNEQEIIIELADEGTDTVQSPFDFTLAEHFENLTLTGAAVSATGNAAVNRLTGNALGNVLLGLDGNDVLNGAAGADTLIGGAGNDTYVVDHSSDQVIELAGEGLDTIQTTISYGLAVAVENLTLTGTAAINGTGNTLANRLTGNAAANTLSGMEGNDIIDGKAGADLLIGGAGNDIYYVDQSDDAVLELADEGLDLVNSSATFALSAEVENLTLSGTAMINGTGNAGANKLTGNAADNRLEGLGGNDVLDGKAGADTLAGGAGDDLYVADQAGDIVVEAADEGIDTVQSAVSWTLVEHVENLTLTGAALVNGTGNAADNTLTGNNVANRLTGLEGNDWLDGKGGNDTLVGGIGDDVYVVAQTADVVVELADEGQDTVRSGITWTLGENLEHLVLTGTAGIRGTGNAQANTLAGNSGNNQLDGLAGADLMTGGAGNDTYLVDDAGDQVVELTGEGIDLVKSSATYSLAAEVENLTLTGASAINGTGNALNNVITGNAAANTLTGGAGNDALNGGAGVDTLLGGTGDDFYTVDNAGDIVVELDGEGVDTVNSSLNYTLTGHVENLALTGSANRNGTGNALDNTIAGNRGINILNGMAGNDLLAGGQGSDTYRFDDLNFGRDVIAEDDATAGNLDRIQFGAAIAASDISLGRFNDDLVVHTANNQHSIQVMDWFAGDTHKVERIEFANGVFWDTATIESTAMQVVDMPGLLRGNDSASSLLGQIGNTILEGNGGSDVLSDGDGNNLYSGGTDDDVITGGAGNDLFAGGSGNDTLITGGGSNIIAYNAGGGVDTVYADAGAENTLSLGGGLQYADLSLSRDSNDLVLNTGVDDKIILKDWYAGNTSLLNLQVILDATDAFDANATDSLYNRRVQNFDFLGMVSAFDAAQAVNPGLSQWALGDALTQYHLSGADDAALGGDLAYWYARNGGFTGIGVASAQQIIGAPGFGAEAQGLREFSGLQEGLVRLS